MIVSDVTYRQEQGIARAKDNSVAIVCTEVETYLVKVQWVQVQSVKGVARRALALAPFLHLGRAKIVRSVDITSLPVAGLELLQSSAFTLSFLFLEESQAVW